MTKAWIKYQIQKLEAQVEVARDQWRMSKRAGNEAYALYWVEVGKGLNYDIDALKRALAEIEGQSS
jgi:hypothetical protein